MSDDSLSKLQTSAIKRCKDCPMLVRVSGNVLHELTGDHTHDGQPLHLCADDGDLCDPELVPGHGCSLYERGPMLAYLVTPRS